MFQELKELIDRALRSKNDDFSAQEWTKYQKLRSEFVFLNNLSTDTSVLQTIDRMGPGTIEYLESYIGEARKHDKRIKELVRYVRKGCPYLRNPEAEVRSYIHPSWPGADERLDTAIKDAQFAESVASRITTSRNVKEILLAFKKVGITPPDYVRSTLEFMWKFGLDELKTWAEIIRDQIDDTRLTYAQKLQTRFKKDTALGSGLIN